MCYFFFINLDSILTSSILCFQSCPWGTQNRSARTLTPMVSDRKYMWLQHNYKSRTAIFRVPFKGRWEILILFRVCSFGSLQGLTKLITVGISSLCCYECSTFDYTNERSWINFKWWTLHFGLFIVVVLCYSLQVIHIWLGRKVAVERPQYPQIWILLMTMFHLILWLFPVGIQKNFRLMMAK